MASSPYKENWALYGDEVRFLIFDRMTENRKKSQRPQRRVNCQTCARAARAPRMEKIYETLLKPAHARRAGSIHWLFTAQVVLEY